MDNATTSFSRLLLLIGKTVICTALLFDHALAQPQSFAASFAPTPFGRFQGRLVLLPDGNGGRMRLLEPYLFIDAAGGNWLAPAGFVSDGASIPQFAKSFVGGGWDGRYLHAAVIHDVACVYKTRPWELVHLTFYHAMLAAGVDTGTAKRMYAAVYHFGPRWEIGGNTKRPPSGGWWKAGKKTESPSPAQSCIRLLGLGNMCLQDPVIRNREEAHPRASDVQAQQLGDHEAFGLMLQEMDRLEANGELSIEQIQNL